MIRLFVPSDEDAVIEVWLEASLQAHHFVKPGFWKSKETDVRERYLPQSEVWVYEDDRTGKVSGFIALHGDYVAALFVTPGQQGKGIGYRLVEKAKSMYPSIRLSVYKENTGSVAFYERQGFIKVGEGIEPETGHPHWQMWYPG